MLEPAPSSKRNNSARRRFGSPKVVFPSIILAVSIALLIYSLIFFSTFRDRGFAVSYFPWRWGVTYSGSSSVMKLFELGIGSGGFFALSSGLALVVFLRRDKLAGVPSISSETTEIYDPDVISAPKDTSLIEPKLRIDTPLANSLANEQQAQGQDITRSSYENRTTLEQEKTKSAAEDSLQSDQIQLEESGHTMKGLHERLGRKSRLGAVALMVLSFALLTVSYELPNLIVEINSVIAFIGGLVLLFKEESHSIQLRIVDRILRSTHDFLNSATSGILTEKAYSYVPLGPTVSDVVIVPSVRTAEFMDEKRKDGSPDLGGTMVPPGRGLAQLFEREMSLEKPSLDGVLATLPTVICERFELASSAMSKQLTNDSLVITLTNPVLRNSCQEKDGREKSDAIVGCEVCSMLATVICHVTQRETIAKGCSFDLNKQTSSIGIRLGEPPNGR